MPSKLIPRPYTVWNLTKRFWQVYSSFYDANGNISILYTEYDIDSSKN